MNKITLGQRLRNWRTEKKLSQLDLENLSGIKREYISKIENDYLDNPTIDTVSKLAYAMSLSVVEFLGGTITNNGENIILENVRLKNKIASYENDVNKIIEALKGLL